MQGDHGKQDSRGRLKFCTLLEFHLRDILSSRLFHVFMTCLRWYVDCLLVVVDVFEVVVGGY